MARDVKLPPELELAAEKLLDLEIPEIRSRAMFRLALFRKARERANGNDSDAARKLGMSRQNFQQGMLQAEARAS